MDFNAIKNNEQTFDKKLYNKYLEPWSKVFGFEFDEKCNPVTPQPKLSEPKEGVYRPQSTIELLQPHANPYQGLDKEGKFQFYFDGPILNSCPKAQKVPRKTQFLSGDILHHPSYIYAPLKIATNPYTDEVFMRAMNELDMLITIGDMHFTDANNHRGNSCQYGCPFYLSFLKTQVVILLVNSTSIRLWKNKESSISVGNFGVYDPYYKVASWTHPAIYLDVEAMRAHALKEQKDPVELYQRTLLTLLAYAYQDPTNEIDEKGTFTKMSMDRSDRINIHYDKQAAEAFVNSYFSLSHN